MRESKSVILVVVMALMFSGIGFAEELPFDQPLGEKQEHLFFVPDLPNNKLYEMCSFIYVAELNQIQILQDSGEEGVVFGYDFSGKRSSNIAEVEYPVMNMNSATLSALSKINSERIYLTREKMVSDQGDVGDRERIQGLDIRLMSFDDSLEEAVMDVPIYSGLYGHIRGLYTTKDYIVIFYIDDQMTGFIERYTYGGVLHDRVTVNVRTKGMVEGPDGSTLYIQKADPTRVDGEDECDDPIEMVQINWEAGKEISSGSGPRPVIQEQTRVGSTIARFTDNQFGLLRVEEPETGIVDYSAPIRSSENLVKLQIPYCDIKAKMESGARNLMVEYQDQTLTFPMEFFACDEMLAAMPCQTDATIEIIMQTDESGNVTYKVQLFVVEQVNGMTKVVHRKTIQ